MQDIAAKSCGVAAFEDNDDGDDDDTSEDKGSRGDRCSTASEALEHSGALSNFDANAEMS